ncbi:MAG: nucleotidyl transferase AbiEii/AbiGii toxin family protein [Solirubrobacteraceae bacterium]
MISAPYLTEWRAGAPWPTAAQVEQDLILSRLIVEIADHELLSRELAFRGGTCLHKLHLPAAYRYSEDLDYVRTSDEPRLGEILNALREIAVDRIGLREHRRRFPSEDSDVACIWFDATPTDSGGRIRIKIEINVAETEPLLGYSMRPYAVRSRWWSGEAQVGTFAAEELLATKLRALYQRRKGRDLFDLWLALAQLDIEDQSIVDGLHHYMRDRTFTYPQLALNLERKVASPVFINDLDALLSERPAGYEPRLAADAVMRRLGMRLRNAPEDK